MSRIIKSKKSYNNGKQFETYLENIFRGYELQNKGALYKINEERVGRGGNAFKLKRKLRTDFEGYIIINNTPVYTCIEAKNIHKGSYFPFSNLKEHQLTALNKINNINGYGFLVISFFEKQKIATLRIEKKIYESIMKLYDGKKFHKGINLKQLGTIANIQDYFSYDLIKNIEVMYENAGF